MAYSFSGFDFTENFDVEPTSVQTMGAYNYYQIFRPDFVSAFPGPRPSYIQMPSYSSTNRSFQIDLTINNIDNFEIFNLLPSTLGTTPQSTQILVNVPFYIKGYGNMKLNARQTFSQATDLFVGFRTTFFSNESYSMSSTNWVHSNFSNTNSFDLNMSNFDHKINVEATGTGSNPSNIRQISALSSIKFDLVFSLYSHISSTNRGTDTGISMIENWVSTKSYRKNETVFHAGNAYVLISDLSINNNPTNSFSDWRLLGALGSNPTNYQGFTLGDHIVYGADTVSTQVLTNFSTDASNVPTIELSQPWQPATIRGIPGG